MATFKEGEEFRSRLDWSILQNGWSSAYWKVEILETDIAWFTSENFTVIEFDCANWVTPKVIQAT